MLEIIKRKFEELNDSKQILFTRSEVAELLNSIHDEYVTKMNNMFEYKKK